MSCLHSKKSTRSNTNSNNNTRTQVQSSDDNTPCTCCGSKCEDESKSDDDSDDDTVKKKNSMLKKIESHNINGKKTQHKSKDGQIKKRLRSSRMMDINVRSVRV